MPQAFPIKLKYCSTCRCDLLESDPLESTTHGAVVNNQSNMLGADGGLLKSQEELGLLALSRQGSGLNW